MELRSYLIPLRKWWWLIVAATLVASTSAFLATRNQPRIYRTAATVMVGGSITNPVPQGGDSYQAQQIANTYVDVVQRKPIRDATMTVLGLTWLPGYNARQIPNTQLLEISVVDSDPRRAQAVANELVNQLAKLSAAGVGRDDQQQAFLAQQLSDLQTQINDTKAEIAKQQKDLATLLSARQIADAQNQINGLQNKLSTLQQNYATLLSNTRQEAVNVVTLVEPADLPNSPLGTQRQSTILLAAVIGFLLAAGAAYLMEYLDDTLKNPDDVKKVMDLTTLGAVPLIKPVDGKVPLAMLSGAHSLAAEAYRVLRTNLQFAGVDRPLRSLMITSPSPDEGKSLTATNLAVATAQAGQQVVLVDADLHRPKQHRLLGLRNNLGLTTALLEDNPDLDGLLQQTSVPGLRLLTTGPLPPNPSELLGSRRMRALEDALAAHADLVIYDTPPVMALADAATLGSRLDGVLMVISAGGTRREMARRAMLALQHVNAHVVGALLNRMPAEQSGYYYYYYQYGYRAVGEGDSSDGTSSGRRGRFGGLFRRGHRGRRTVPPLEGRRAG